MSSALERPRTDATELAATQCRPRVDHRLGRDAGGVETGLLGEPRDQVDQLCAPVHDRRDVDSAAPQLVRSDQRQGPTRRMPRETGHA